MAKALQRSSSALLALLLAIATGWQGDLLADAGRTVAIPNPVCKCCDFDPAKCPTPACCARPSDSSRAPVVPVAPRPLSGTERHAIAVDKLLAISTLPHSAVHE